jgi:sulfur relay (sulfurtransferase) DsrC/TusE family protein|tara:strand:+ start:1180 stop:1401 length:222 start_codon:yes stop_codon:yes gene_type:complete
VQFTEEEWHEWSTSPITKQFVKEIKEMRSRVLEDRFSSESMFSLCKDYCLSQGKRDGYEDVIEAIELKKGKGE